MRIVGRAKREEVIPNQESFILRPLTTWSAEGSLFSAAMCSAIARNPVWRLPCMKLFQDAPQRLTRRYPVRKLGVHEKTVSKYEDSQSLHEASNKAIIDVSVAEDLPNLRVAAVGKGVLYEFIAVDARSLRTRKGHVCDKPEVVIRVPSVVRTSYVSLCQERSEFTEQCPSPAVSLAFCGDFRPPPRVVVYSAEIERIASAVAAVEGRFLGFRMNVISAGAKIDRSPRIDCWACVSELFLIFFLTFFPTFGNCHKRGWTAALRTGQMPTVRRFGYNPRAHEPRI